MIYFDFPPEKASYSYTSAGTVRSQELAAGASRQRKASIGEAVHVNANWILTRKEYQTMLTLARKENSTSEAFQLDLVIDKGDQTRYIVKFVPGTFQLTEQSGQAYFVRAELECRVPTEVQYDDMWPGTGYAPIVEGLSQTALGIITNHLSWLDRHTGNEPDSSAPDAPLMEGDTRWRKWLMNTSSLIADHMHFTEGGTWRTPNGTSTTEGQSLLIVGMYWAWKATGNKNILNRCIAYAEAYINIFYAGVPPPESPQIWLANWMANAKQPFLTFGPTNTDNSDGPGKRDLALSFTAGVATIPENPSGQSTWSGSKLAWVYRVYSGTLNYKSVRAHPVSPGVEYDVEYFVDKNGNKFGPDGQFDYIEPTMTTPGNASGHPAGRIKLKTAFTGTLNVAYATMTGSVIGRNGIMDVWPTWRTVDPANLGNAIDAEQWFCEGMWLLMNEKELTEEQRNRYAKAFDSSAYVCKFNASLGTGLYFKKTATSGISAFTEGLSYMWTYLPAGYTGPNDDEDILRTSDGYIILTPSGSPTTAGQRAQIALEQMGVYTPAKAGEIMFFDLKASNSGTPVNIEITTQEVVNGAFSGSSEVWYMNLYPSTVEHHTYLIKLDSFHSGKDMATGTSWTPLTDDNGYTYGAPAQFVTYTNENIQINTLDSTNPWVGLVTTIEFNNSTRSSGGAGFYWSTARPIGDGFTYRTLQERVWVSIDVGAETYYAELPQTGGAWTWVGALSWFKYTGTYVLNPATGNYYNQFTSVSVPNSTLVDQIEFSNEWPGGGTLPPNNTIIEVFCFGKPPGKFNAGTNKYIRLLTLIAKVLPSTRVEVGNVQSIKDDLYKYVPGVLPFSNQYSPTTQQNAGWRGDGYVGYQHPAVWFFTGKRDHWERVIDFWNDAQTDFHTKSGTWGPMTPVWIWFRWDADGTPDQFGYGTDLPYPWGGYQARAMHAGGHLLWLLATTYSNTAKFATLRTITERWIVYLNNFQLVNRFVSDSTIGMFPTRFPIAPALPFNGDRDSTTGAQTSVNDDFTDHMTALWMRGAVDYIAASRIAGFTAIPEATQLIVACLNSLQYNYNRGMADTGPYDMAGSFSPYPGGGMAYGFYTGEVLGALSRLMLLDKGL